MAIPSDDFKGFKTNKTFLAPALDIADLNVLDSGRSILTAWELSDSELEEIIKTKTIYVAILGQNLPPLAVSTDLLGLIELNPTV